MKRANLIWGRFLLQTAKALGAGGALQEFKAEAIRDERAEAIAIYSAQVERLPSLAESLIFDRPLPAKNAIEFLEQSPNGATETFNQAMTKAQKTEPTQ